MWRSPPSAAAIRGAFASVRGAFAQVGGAFSRASARFLGLGAFDRVRVAASALALPVLVAAIMVGGSGGTAPSSEGGGRGAREEARRSFLAQMIPPRPDPVLAGSPRSVAELAERLPLERKVAQLLVVGFDGTKAAPDIERRLRSADLGGVAVRAENYESPGQLARLTADAENAARGAGHVSPLVLAAQEGGEFSAFDDLPPERPPAALESAAQARSESRKSARALRAVGIDGVLGPVVDIGAEGGPLGKRAYSDDADEVSEYGRAALDGLMSGRAFAAPAHFPGLGAAAQSTDDGPASVGLDLPDLRSRDLLPFAAVVAAGAPGILVGNGSYATDDFVTPASLSPAIVIGLLRDELGFEGVAIADDLSSPAVAAVASVPDAAVEALAAGADMVYLGATRGDEDAALIAVQNAVRDGDISKQRLDQAVLRVLTAKEDLGLIR